MGRKTNAHHVEQVQAEFIEWMRKQGRRTEGGTSLVDFSTGHPEDWAKFVRESKEQWGKLKAGIVAKATAIGQ